MRLFLPPLHRRHHGLLRLLAAVIGVAVLGFMFVFGLLAIALLLVVGVVMLGVRQWRLHQAKRTGQPQGATPPPPPPGVIEGEFVVMPSRHHATHSS